MDVNPVIPVQFEILAVLLPLAIFALLVTATVSIARASGLSTKARVVWMIAAIVVPLVSPGAWFLAGRPAVKMAGGQNQ